MATKFSVYLEGEGLAARDSNGLSDPYIKFGTAIDPGREDFDFWDVRKEVAGCPETFRDKAMEISSGIAEKMNEGGDPFVSIAAQITAAVGVGVLCHVGYPALRKLKYLSKRGISRLRYETIGQTETIAEELNPKWGWYWVNIPDDQNFLYISCWDEDDWSDDIIGRCKISREYFDGEMRDYQLVDRSLEDAGTLKCIVKLYDENDEIGEKDAEEVEKEAEEAEKNKEDEQAGSPAM